jgi:trans-aconitate methyltransferase
VNREAYDAIAARWDAARTALVENEAKYLAHFTVALRPNARVIDLGCGTGRPVAERLVELGHRVVGVDQSEGMLALARARMPSQTWVCASLETFVPDGAFDGAMAWDALFHIARDHHADIIARVRAALVPGSPFALTVGGSAQPAFTDTMFGQTFFYDSHPPEVAVHLLEAAGFRVTLQGFLNRPTAGRDKGRYAIVAVVA